MAALTIYSADSSALIVGVVSLPPQGQAIVHRQANGLWPTHGYRRAGMATYQGWMEAFAPCW
jgi:hypothetical protein